MSDGWKIWNGSEYVSKEDTLASELRNAALDAVNKHMQRTIGAPVVIQPQPPIMPLQYYVLAHSVPGSSCLIAICAGSGSYAAAVTHARTEWQTNGFSATVRDRAGNTVFRIGTCAPPLTLNPGQSPFSYSDGSAEVTGPCAPSATFAQAVQDCLTDALDSADLTTLRTW